MTPKEELNAKQIIMNTALKLFAEKGIDGVSVREIAKESGQNISQISYYFESKQGLYTTIIKEHSEHISNRIHQVIQEFSTEGLNQSQFEKQMKNFIAIFVNMRTQNPHIAKIMQRETLEGMPHVKDIHNEVVQPLVALMDDYMKKAKKNKIVKADVNSQIFFVLLTESIWGFMAKKDCKWNVLDAAFKFPRDYDLFIDAVYKIFFKGILV